MNWTTFVGTTIGSFAIPAAVFWIFFRWARSSERMRISKLLAGWLLGLFLIYAATLPSGRGFLNGLEVGDVLAVVLGVFLTIMAFRGPAREVPNE